MWLSSRLSCSALRLRISIMALRMLAAQPTIFSWFAHGLFFLLLLLLAEPASDLRPHASVTAKMTALRQNRTWEGEGQTRWSMRLKHRLLSFLLVSVARWLCVIAAVPSVYQGFFFSQSCHVSKMEAKSFQQKRLRKLNVIWSLSALDNGAPAEIPPICIWIHVKLKRVL